MNKAQQLLELCEASKRNTKSSYQAGDYIIELDDEPESGARGMWQVFDKNMKLIEFEINSEIEAVFKTKKDAENALKHKLAKK